MSVLWCVRIQPGRSLSIGYLKTACFRFLEPSIRAESCRQLVALTAGGLWYKQDPDAFLLSLLKTDVFS